jgi:hypothetical protein
MALLTLEKRKEYFKELGLEYNASTIKALQLKYMTRKSDADGIYGKDTDNMLRTVRNVLKYTKNFDPKEFRCNCGHCCGFPSYMKKVELQNLQKIRTHYGKPMTVTSGLRCRVANNVPGSITNSKHLVGYACDFYMAGVTDTLANRKAFIKWAKKLEGTAYIYGNQINSLGVRVSAPYMGNAIHYETRKVETKTATLAAAAATPKPQTNRQKLAAKAWEFAYHSNSKKAKYPSGKPKKAYKDALDKYFGKNRKWSTPAKKGASCDVFVATCIRAAGLGKAPRGLVRSWLDKSKNFKRVKVTYKTIKDGDIISIVWSNGNPHWAMAYKGKVLEASYGGFYPKTTNKLKSRLSKSGKQSVVVYRAK